MVSPNYSRFSCAHKGTDFPNGLWRERRSSKPQSPPNIWAFQGDWPLAVSFSEVTEAFARFLDKNRLLTESAKLWTAGNLIHRGAILRNLASQDSPDFATSRRHSPYPPPRAKVTDFPDTQSAVKTFMKSECPLLSTESRSIGKLTTLLAPSPKLLYANLVASGIYPPRPLTLASASI